MYNTYSDDDLGHTYDADDSGLSSGPEFNYVQDDDADNVNREDFNDSHSADYGPSQYESDFEEMPDVPFLKATRLYEMFPNMPKAAVDMIYKMSSKCYVATVNCLLDLSPETMLTMMQKFCMTKPAVKLTLEEEHMLEDALAFYKNNSFDPRRPLRISFVDQPAVDTGGVMQHFFHNVFEHLAFRDPYSMFEGEQHQLRPHFSPGLLPLFKILGMMIAHSLCQNGPGFPYFAPYVYWYIATSSEEMALSYVSDHDLSVPVREIINQVSKF